MTSMEIVWYDKKCLKLTIRGSLNVSVVDVIQPMFLSFILLVEEINLDFSEVNYLDAAGVNFFETIKNAAKKNKKRVSISNDSQLVISLLPFLTSVPNCHKETLTVW